MKCLRCRGAGVLARSGSTDSVHCYECAGTGERPEHRTCACETCAELRTKRHIEDVYDEAILANACVNIAMTAPNIAPWRKDRAPWGCVHVQASRVEYCDGCPSQDWCPLPKEWSK